MGEAFAKDKKSKSIDGVSRICKHVHKTHVSETHILLNLNTEKIKEGL